MDKYLHFTPIELANEESFIRWAKNNPRNEDFDWETWIKANASKTSDIKTAQKIVLGIHFKQEHVPQTTEDRVWSKISKDISDTAKTNATSSSKKTSIFKLISYGAVAAIALILLMVNIGSDMDTSVQTPYAMTKTITLPDGSTVQMNADSQIEYDNKTWENNRYVSLDGEAFFSVIKGSKFIVATDQGNIQVLGTSFNVNTRNKSLNVLCKTGRVAVSSNAKETTLGPNQAVTIVNNTHTFIEDITHTIDRTSWTEGKYVYYNHPLSNVISELERQYEINIKIDPSHLETKYSGSFSNGNLNNSLSEVFWPLGLQYKVNGKDITITKE